MSILVHEIPMPKSCSECKLDLRTDICKAFCEWKAEHPYSIRATDRLPDCPLSEVPELCEDTVPRASVEYICRKNTVSTNPYEHEYHEKFIKFIEDPEISDFGMWQHSIGFNTALVAVKCDLDRVPSAQPEVIRCNACRHWHQNVGDMEGFGLGDCDYLGKKLVTCNGYCYWAERRTDGQTD